MDAGAGESGRDSEASAALSPGRSPPRLPVVPGERPPAPRAAGAPALVAAGQGTGPGGGAGQRGGSSGAAAEPSGAK